MQAYIKLFDEWNAIKKRIHNAHERPAIRSGEIRWAAIGVNIGSEMDGKGVSFTRPVLVLHVVGTHLALVIPLSTKIKDVPGYMPFSWKGKDVSLCIHQIRVIAQQRIFERKGRISDSKLSAVKQEVLKFFTL